MDRLHFKRCVEGDCRRPHEIYSGASRFDNTEFDEERSIRPSFIYIHLSGNDV